MRFGGIVVTVMVVHKLVPLALLGLVTALLGCVVEPGQADTGGSSDGGSSTTLVPTDDTGTTSIEPPPGSTDDTTTTGAESSESTTAEPPAFACPPRPGERQCDLVAQDCPAGLHCIPFSTDGLVFDSVVCAPLAEPPAGRLGECSLDAMSCSDDCETGAFCLPVGEVDDAGLCLGACDPEGDDATCLPGEACVTCADCLTGTCLPTCDPLDPQCPAGLPTCFPLEPDAFTCVPGEPAGTGFGESCVDVATCSPGLFCASAELFGDGCDSAGCCTEFCDVLDGDPGCSSPAHVCIPFYLPGTAPAGFEHVGVCGVPEADPCLVPGACPPPGIDDTYPWCTDTNDAYCPDGPLAGYGNAITCETGCICLAACVDAADCPVPPTGTAIPQCVDEPFGAGSPTACMLSCAAGETCPDGMTCDTMLSGEPLCIWVSPLPPAEC